jgi:DNA polymerase IV
VLHMDLDSFFVSVERHMDRRLLGVPVLVGGLSDRGVVAACSYEARSTGVRSGMPMRMARELCPEAVVVRGNSMEYSKHSNVVTEIVREAVPVLEKASIDEFYADLSGMDRFFGTYQFAQELRERIIRESGLPISFGLSTNKTVAKVATGEAKPNNHRHVPPGVERPFMAPLSVRKIPMVGEKTYQTLRVLGVQRIATLQEMPSELLYQVLGKPGLDLWNKAHGVDERPVKSVHERKSISTERTFEQDTLDEVKLRGLLAAMTENLAFQLRRGHRLTSNVAVRIRYADFQTVSRQRQIPYTASDRVLLDVAEGLFRQLHDRRQRVRLVGVRLSGLVGGGEQFGLFELDDRGHRLSEAMDRIRVRYGDRAVVRAFGMAAQTIGRSNPFNGDPPPLLANRRQ